MIKKKIGNSRSFQRKGIYDAKGSKNISHDKKIGMPLVLNNYDLLPFWTNFFDVLGYEVVWSTPSTLDMYHDGQHTIPSDTACFPAKLVHGHIKQLVDQELSLIFYPCMTYNLDENQSDNHYNCPLVAYYPEVIAANMDLNNTKFLYPFISFDNEKNFVEKMIKAFETVDIHFNKMMSKLPLERL